MLIKAYENRAKHARGYWIKTIKKLNNQTNHVTPLRAEGLRKHISDSPMRYTELMNKVSDWAYGAVREHRIPVSISNRLPIERQRKLLLQLAQDDQSATWLKELNLTTDQTADLQNTGHLYNQQWLLDHDTRWGVALIDTVLDRMHKAELI